MRAFIAVDIPESAQSALASFQSRIAGSRGVIRARHFHVTLKFLGEIGELQAKSAVELLAAVQQEPFEAVAAGIGFFPDERRPRVVWAGMEPASEFEALHEKTDLALKGLFPADARFSPHITLARIQEHGRDVVKAAKEAVLERVPFRVDRFALKKSVLGRGGPVYEDLAVFPLAGKL